MGNCLRHQSSMQWAGEDWGATAEASDNGTDKGGGKIGFITSSSSAAAASSTEIKIKITKKQLEELLLGKADVKDLTVQQVLVHLMMNVNVSTDRYHHHETHQRSWRPVLQSIPEVN